MLQNYEDAIFRPISSNPRWYHIKVKNEHGRKLALNYVAYLRSIRKISGQQTNKKIYELVELKWKSVKTRDVFIPLQEYRCLDAFQVIHASPNTVQLIKINIL